MQFQFNTEVSIPIYLVIQLDEIHIIANLKSCKHEGGIHENQFNFNVDLLADMEVAVLSAPNKFCDCN